MNQLILLKSQKNEILKMIKKAKLNPINFKWSVVSSSMTPELQVSRIDYVGSGYFFKFDFEKGGERHAFCSPGDQRLIEHMLSEHSKWGSWAEDKSSFRDWLFYLNREIYQPDLWAEISKYQLPPESEVVPDISNEPFTTYQVEKILSGLNQVRAYLEEQRLGSEEQKRFVKERLNYLADAAKRQGRKDWVHTCIGVLVTITTALALSPEQAETLWYLIRDAMAGIILFLPR
nr:hypothetical protein BSM_21310 [uncultured archaeon]